MLPSCQPIEGATGTEYRVQTADIGKRLRNVITAANAAGSASQRSTATAKVLPGSPLNLVPPKVSGTPLVGQTLTAENGTWVGTPPIEYAYQWYACTMSGCEKLVGQTEQGVVSQLLRRAQRPRNQLRARVVGARRLQQVRDHLGQREDRE